MNVSIKCIVVDDEPLAINVIKEYITQVPQLELVTTCTDAIQAYQALNEYSIDLLFLDIEMPQLNGIDFIKSLANPPAVILTTAYRDYALESYEITVVDYLLKPISFSRFFKAVTKYLSTSNKVTNPQATPTSNSQSGSIYVYANKKNIKVYFDEILYLESIKDYVRIYTTGKNIITKDTISKYEMLLPNPFMRIHRSFIVNSAKITAFTSHDIEIDEKELPIGTSYKKRIIELLKK